MHTLIVDDRQLIVNSVKRILTKIDPDGVHTEFTSALKAAAFAKGNVIDVAFLDIEMPEMSGLDLAKKLQGINPLVNIIFITGYEEYAMDAHQLYASAFLTKPVTEKAVREALAHLRYRPKDKEVAEKKLKVKCFGSFEVFANGRPVEFKRAKTKELFAYLIDQNGSMCTSDSMIGVLWPDDPATDSKHSYLRNLVADMKSSLEKIDAVDVVRREHNTLGVVTEKIDCDYYRFLDGDPVAIHQFRGEYMTQYSFAAVTEANLQMQFMEE